MYLPPSLSLYTVHISSKGSCLSRHRKGSWRLHSVEKQAATMELDIAKSSIRVRNLFTANCCQKT